MIESGGKVVAVDALAADGDGRVINLFKLKGMTFKIKEVLLQILFIERHCLKI